MSQNKKSLIDRFIWNLSNAIIHQILDKATQNEEISLKYRKEINTSLDKSKTYRETINPKASPLPQKDLDDIRNKITNKVKSELIKRISQGYKNIDLNLVEELVNKVLKETKIS